MPEQGGKRLARNSTGQPGEAGEGQASRGKQAKARIRQAFTKLLREKPIQRIAVKELCQEAGVNRSTFYAHYQDIYDLLTKIEEDMLEDFQRALAPLLEPGPEAISPLEITRGIYRCLQENADVCTVTLGEFGDKDFALRLLNIGRESWRTWPGPRRPSCSTAWSS